MKINDAFLIKGGKPLKGEVLISGAKNAALKLIISSLLFDHPVTLKNVPEIGDVYALIELIKDLGGRAYFQDKNVLYIDGRGLTKNKVNLYFGSKIRVSFMFFAPLLYRFGECYIPNPGGCRIGARPIDRIIEGMRSLGITVEYSSQTGYYYAKMTKKPSGYYRFEKPSHTGTEFLIMLSIFNQDKVIIENPAKEPEIDNLIEFLNQNGAKIKKEKNKIVIEGIKKLNKPKPFSVINDRNEVITYATLSLASGGEILINSINPDLIETFLKKVKQTGNQFTIYSGDKIKFIGKPNFKAVNITTAPHPGFMTDWQPNWAVLMTQAKGTALIHERVFEGRFSYVEELRKLGVKIEFSQPKITAPEKYYYFNYDKNKQYLQAIKIHGSQTLHGGVLNITDLRAGATLAIAALIAQGESIINNASILERGYEQFVNKIINLGGNIKRYE
jgi:UDP-N-acetylglucosamine 1-carboxyvinyltransferase